MKTLIGKIRRAIAGKVPETAINVALQKRAYSQSLRAQGVSRKEAERRTWEHFQKNA